MPRFMTNMPRCAASIISTTPYTKAIPTQTEEQGNAPWVIGAHVGNEAGVVLLLLSTQWQQTQTLL